MIRLLGMSQDGEQARIQIVCTSATMFTSAYGPHSTAPTDGTKHTYIIVVGV